MTTTAETVTYTYDIANRLTTAGGVSYTYDGNGNLTNDGIYTYTWTVAGRMIGAESVTHTLVYTYNGDGVRVAQEIDGQFTRWVQDQASSLAQVLLEVSGSQTTAYLYGLGRLSQVEGSDAEWFLGDALGSVRQLVDDTGAVVLARDYTPYGQELSESGTGSSGYGFTGEQFGIGLVFLRARYYSPMTGRFLSQDPWEGNYELPLTMNSYLYVIANPVRWVDPTGLYHSIDGGGNVCNQGDCDVHEVVKYIVTRMRIDTASQELEEIRRLNESHFLEDAIAAYENMTWWQQLLFGNQYLQKALGTDMAARSTALAKFGCLVADGRLRPSCGQWDYKEEIGPRWGQAQKIDFCSIGYDEEEIFYYDIWANVHFAYVGMAGGFSEDLLLTGAAIEHAGSNPGQFGDDSSDRVCAQIGAHLYKTALSEKALLRQIYIHRAQLNKAIVENGTITEIYQ